MIWGLWCQKQVSQAGISNCIPQVLMTLTNIRYIFDYELTKDTPYFALTGTWWRHQMETFSTLLAICAGNSPVPGEFPAQRPVMRSFDVFFDLRLNKRLSKQSWGWWFETQSRPLWRHRNASFGVSFMSILNKDIHLINRFDCVYRKALIHIIPNT